MSIIYTQEQQKMAAKILALIILSIASSITLVYGGDVNQDINLTWGGDRAAIIDEGKFIRLSLDSSSGSGFQSKKAYLFGRIDMQLKLVGGDSAGTVTAFYLSSEGANHNEIDFEFLGNTSGEPYIVHTNIYTQGKGEREQQFYLWFDPTKNFHTYSFIWNPQQIIFLVDNIPIRVFNNEESKGVPFPKDQPMKLYSSLWCAEQWATRGGLVKTDWTKAPFRAYYRNFNANANSCTSSSTSSCASETMTNAWTRHQDLDANARRRLRWVHKYYMIYNYCNDFERFPQGLPRECQSSRFT